MLWVSIRIAHLDLTTWKLAVPALSKDMRTNSPNSENYSSPQITYSDDRSQPPHSPPVPFDHLVRSVPELHIAQCTPHTCLNWPTRPFVESYEHILARKLHLEDITTLKQSERYQKYVDQPTVHPRNWLPPIWCFVRELYIAREPHTHTQLGLTPCHTHATYHAIHHATHTSQTFECWLEIFGCWAE